jgi:alkanesulfonate monooxygenase SsuD/methylene tetrahydromethanopterin reductase-like flavin-dependent oxidoreductase (luciferase family)
MLLVLCVAGFVGPTWPLRPTVFLLGAANGSFAVAAPLKLGFVSPQMDRVHNRKFSRSLRSLSRNWRRSRRSRIIRTRVEYNFVILFVVLVCDTTFAWSRENHGSSCFHPFGRQGPGNARRRRQKARYWALNLPSRIGRNRS